MGKVIDYINSSLSFKDEYKRIFGKSVPEGKMFCPFHNNVNTPAAKVYGNVLKCFSCNRIYTVYDLLKKYDPKRIEEVKQSNILPDVDTKSKQIKLVSFDRNKPIKDIICTILSN